MSTFALWAGTSVGLAVLAGLALVGGWVALRLAGVRRWSLPDLLLAIAIVTILVLTLRQGRGNTTSGWQLPVFADLVGALSAGPRSIGLVLADMIGNVVLFVPLGAAIALRWPRLSEVRAVVTVVAVSLAIELTQWLAPLGRTAQTTDLLMNGLGGWIGWLVVARLRRSAIVSDAVRRRR